MMLSELRAFDKFKVVSIHTGRETGRRLADMGFTNGSEGTVMRCGFLHGPLHVCVGGYQLLVRYSEAAAVEIEVLEYAPRGSRRALGGGQGRGKGRPAAACHVCEDAPAPAGTRPRPRVTCLDPDEVTGDAQS